MFMTCAPEKQTAVHNTVYIMSYVNNQFEEIQLQVHNIQQKCLLIIST